VVYRPRAMVSCEPETRPTDVVGPNALVRWGFYLSVFAIPFSHLYLPGTGERVGVLRLVQVVLGCAVLSQLRVCLRLVPMALFWFLGYCAWRVVCGLWLTPEMSTLWWPSSREFLEFVLWLWVMFNVLQFPEARRGGLWALGLGGSLCALSHLAGIGVSELANDPTGRSSVFGLNPNGLGATYAAAAIALFGLSAIRPATLPQRLLPFPLIAALGVAMAKAGSRTSFLIFGLGMLVLLFFGKSSISKTQRFGSVLLIGAVLTIVMWKIPTVVERFEQLDPHNIGRDNPRARMAPVLWEIFLRNPVLGSGPDGYEFELTRRAMPYLIKEQQLIASHNLALLLLVETGILGLLLFSSALMAGLAAAWRARLESCGSLPLALLLPLAIGGATLCNPSNLLVFWVAMAYALAGAA
jgi:O-antigen ligase